LLSSLTVAMFTSPSIAITAMTKGANDAVKLSISLVALYGLWLGLLNIMEKLGLIDKLAKIMRPLVKFLFGKNLGEDTNKYISTNISANLLGLGNAATPMGINAITSMDKGKEKASTPMIMLVVISATSLQLLPTTVIGMQINHGSANPTSFLLPCIIATVSSTIIGIVLVKLLSKIFKTKQPDCVNSKVDSDNIQLDLPAVANKIQPNKTQHNSTAKGR